MRQTFPADVRMEWTSMNSWSTRIRACSTLGYLNGICEQPVVTVISTCSSSVPAPISRSGRSWPTRPLSKVTWPVDVRADIPRAWCSPIPRRFDESSRRNTGWSDRGVAPKRDLNRNPNRRRKRGPKRTRWTRRKRG